MFTKQLRPFSLQRVARLFQRCNCVERAVTLRNQGSNLRFETCDLRRRRIQSCRLLIACRCQRRDLGLGVAQCCIQFSNLRSQIGVGALFQPQSLRQRRHLPGQLIEFRFLPGDPLCQNELNHHEDRQNEHQNEQKARHRIDKPGPDRGLKARASASRQRH